MIYYITESNKIAKIVGCEAAAHALVLVWIVYKEKTVDKIAEIIARR